jgi:hypothetical protein
LLDDNNIFYNCTIVVASAGTGIAFVKSGAGKNVVVAKCRMNNADNDPDGLGSGVTNLVGTPDNIVDSGIN